MIVLRKERGSPRENQRHVLAMGLMLGLVVLFVQKPLERLSERLFMPDPPIVGNVHAVERTPGAVMVTYEPRVRWPVSAHWIGQIRTESGVVVFTRKSPESWSYAPEKTGRSTRYWTEFWQDESGHDIPPVPTWPFRICLRYEGTGTVGGVSFSSEYVCSDVFDLPPARGD